MSTPNPGYAITVRVQAPAAAGMIGDLTTAIGKAGGVVTALDVVESHADRIVVDVTCNAADAGHVDVITEAIGALDGFNVGKVSDRTFLMHLGGKLEVTPKVPLRHRDDLSRAYTPGVARVARRSPATPTTRAGSRSSATRSPSSRTAPRCWVWATSDQRPRCR